MPHQFARKLSNYVNYRITRNASATAFSGTTSDSSSHTLLLT